MLLDTREDTHILDSLDFDPKCQRRQAGVGCDEAATHRALWSCDCLRLLCTPHAEVFAGKNAEVVSGGGVWYCPTCHVRGIRLLAIEPF